GDGPVPPSSPELTGSEHELPINVGPGGHRHHQVDPHQQHMDNYMNIREGKGLAGSSQVDLMKRVVVGGGAAGQGVLGAVVPPGCSATASTLPPSSSLAQRSSANITDAGSAFHEYDLTCSSR
ncbi:unnamed protein product, partial [Amoebophrya sp. A25]